MGGPIWAISDWGGLLRALPHPPTPFFYSAGVLRAGVSRCRPAAVVWWWGGQGPTCLIRIHVFLRRSHKNIAWLTLYMTGARTYSWLMYSQNWPSMHRIPLFLHRSAYEQALVSLKIRKIIDAEAC